MLELQNLSFPELTEARRRVLEVLIDVSKRDDAAKILKVGKRIISEVEAQRDILRMPCAPAWKVYNGVLYQAAQLRSNDDVMIFSGLFGLTSAHDLIPGYRLSMNIALPGIGSLTSFWRRELAKTDLSRSAFHRERQLSAMKGTSESLETTEATKTTKITETTVDMRSGAYQVTAPQGQSWDLRVVDSRGKVITHAAKHYRGLLTRALLDAQQSEQSDVASDSAEIGNAKASIDVAQVARSLGTIRVAHDGRHHHITLSI